MNTITAIQLEALIQHNAVKSITVNGTSDGFIVSVNGSLIEAKRGHVRTFKKLQAAASFLKNKGIGEFTVDVSQWTQDQDPL